MNAFIEGRIIEEHKKNEKSKLNTYKKNKENLKKSLNVLSKNFQEALLSIEESEHSSKQKSYLKSLIENFNHKKVQCMSCEATLKENEALVFCASCCER